MHNGACTEADKNPRSNMTSTNFTTDSPEAAQTMDNFTLTQEFCADPRPCPSDLNPICGNNRIFYVNLWVCYFFFVNMANNEKQFSRLAMNVLVFAR